MPSPFPGMDPYLEDPARWRDLHQAIINYGREMLQQKLRPHYVAQVDERMYVASSERHIIPDVTIIRPPLREARAEYAVASPVVEPYVLIVPDDPVREPFMEIIVPHTGEVVTVIEVLSPTNKQDRNGWAHYQQKREEVLNSTAHLVEIDLLAEGERVTPEMHDRATGALLDYRYVVSVNRAQSHRERYELYPIRLADRLPHFRIPLKPEHADVTLDLQAVFGRCYDNGAYDLLIDYGKPPCVKLLDAERGFVASVLTRRSGTPD